MPDAALGWRLQPGFKGRHESHSFSAAYEVNALGYRDRPRTVARDTRRRVLLFGDSQVFGWGAAAEHRVSNLLEAAHPDLEVWNLGVPAYGLDQEVLAYEGEGARWNGDAVVLFVSRATIRRTRFSFIYQKFKPRFALDEHGELQFEPAPASLMALSQAAYRLLSPLVLPYFLQNRMAEAGRRLGASTASLEAPAEEPTSEAHGPWHAGAQQGVVEGLLERAGRVAKARGQRLALLVAPSISREGGAELGHWATPRGIDVIAFRFPGDASAFVWGSFDPHWNDAGQQWIAQQLAQAPIIVGAIGSPP